MHSRFTVFVFAWIPLAPWASAQTMHIDSCGIGCTSGSGGAQVNCAITAIAVDQPLRIRFSRPVDPQSVGFATISIVNVNNGLVPIGVRYVDPNDPVVIVFEPVVSFDAAGNVSHGFDANAPYRVTVPGVAQGDSGPFVQSTDVPALDNQSRMLCDVVATIGPQVPGTNSCFGNGSGTSCPCGNNGNFPQGCPNSIDSHGAVLEAFGKASLSDDRVVLRGLFMTNQAVVYFQGTQEVNLGAGADFGDGLLCVGGAIVRLATLTNANSWSSYPNTGGEQVSVKGQVTAPGSRVYQAWYRDTASCCTSDTFNTSNSVSITWSP